MRIIEIIFIYLFLFVNLYADEVNDKNWMKHPEIIKIRSLCNGIMEEIKNGKVEKKKRKCEIIEESATISKIIYIDKDSITRKYIKEGGGESYFKNEYYYNEKGILRFIFGYFASPGGIKIEERIYFDEKGEEIYINHKAKDADWPLKIDYIENPKEDFAELCKEE